MTTTAGACRARTGLDAGERIGVELGQGSGVNGQLLGEERALVSGHVGAA